MTPRLAVTSGINSSQPASSAREPRPRAPESSRWRSHACPTHRPAQRFTLRLKIEVLDPVQVPRGVPGPPVAGSAVAGADDRLDLLKRLVVVRPEVRLVARVPRLPQPLQIGRAHV